MQNVFRSGAFVQVIDVLRDHVAQRREPSGNAAKPESLRPSANTDGDITFQIHYIWCWEFIKLDP